MQPIFKEYIKFLKDNSCDVSWFKENTFWLDRQIIRAFDTTGNECKLYRITIYDDLTIILKPHKDLQKYATTIFENWEDTVNRLSSRLDILEKDSIDLINAYYKRQEWDMVYDTNSTGKDSMVKTHLLKKSGVPYVTKFNVTTLDVGESNRMAREEGFDFVLPESKYGGFYQFCEKNNIIPSRLNRFCCTFFKEGATIKDAPDDKSILFVFGMRNSESTNRSTYTDEWNNEKWGKSRKWTGILPIRKWTDLDIWLYTFRENIRINEKYKYGYDRVGCGIACPNYGKSTWVLDKYWYPSLYARWRERLTNDFVKNNKWLIMNCTINEYIQKAWTGGAFRDEANVEVITEFAEYNNLEHDVAKKYFDRFCTNGCTNNRKKPLKIKDRNVLAMNMKLYGRNIEKFQCKKCFLKEFGWTVDDFDRKVQDFKRQGCQLF